MRQANLELLRLCAMFLVLVVHAAFFSLGTPKADLIRMAPVEQTILTFTESISIICVNVFILISGWFGIKPKIKSLSGFLFQVFFFLFGIYLFVLISGKVSFSLKGLLECLTITKWNWFIKAYLALFLVSPVMNAFVEHTDRKTFKWVLIAFYLLQTVYGWTGLIEFYADGYSTFSFMGLYLLARYLKIYRPDITHKSKLFYTTVYLVCAATLTVLSIAPAFLPISDNIVNMIIPKLFTYICPIVILESVAFFFIFERMTISPRISPTINKIAVSNFAVFLLHTNPNIINPIYKEGIKSLYVSTHSQFWNILCILGFILSFFILAILLDQIRLFCWKHCGTKIEKITHVVVNKILGSKTQTP